MKIKNETEYRTREIRRVLTAVHGWLAKHEGRLHSWKWVRIRVAYTRTWGTSGHAALNGSRATLRLKRPEGLAAFRDSYRRRGEDPRCTVRALVDLAYHEFLHLYGYGHDRMARYFPTKEEAEEMIRAAGFEPGDRLPTYESAREDDEDDEPSEAEKYEAELRHALRKRKEWTTKARRAKTGLSTWRSREMYRRRKLEELGVDVEAIVEDELGGYVPAMAGDLKV